MERNWNTYMADIDLQFWHDLIQQHGTLVTFNEGEYLCRQGERSTAFGYLLSGNFFYEIGGIDLKEHVVNSVFPEALVGNYPDCMYDGVSSFDIKAAVKSFAYLMDARILLNLYKQDKILQKQGRVLIEAMLKSLKRCYVDIVQSKHT